MDKDDGAFLTIGELARELGVAQHILRYWETRFPQLRPLQRSGNRRYYRPRDVEIARKINGLLNDEGFTVRGAQRLLAGRGGARGESGTSATAQSAESGTIPPPTGTSSQASPRSQDELPISDASAPPAGGAGQNVRRSGQVGASDLALLIARLTVIRQNLRDAIGEE